MTRSLVPPSASFASTYCITVVSTLDGINNAAGAYHKDEARDKSQERRVEMHVQLFSHRMICCRSCSDIIPTIQITDERGQGATIQEANVPFVPSFQLGKGV